MVSNGSDINTPVAGPARLRPVAGRPSPGGTLSSPGAWRTADSNAPVRPAYSRPGHRDRSTARSGPGQPDVRTAPAGCCQQRTRPSARARNTNLSLRGHPVLDQAAGDAVNPRQQEPVRLGIADLLA